MRVTVVRNASTARATRLVTERQAGVSISLGKTHGEHGGVDGAGAARRECAEETFGGAMHPYKSVSGLDAEARDGWGVITPSKHAHVEEHVLCGQRVHKSFTRAWMTSRRAPPSN